MKEEMKGRVGGREMSDNEFKDKLKYLQAEADTAQKALQFVKEHDVAYEEGRAQWSFQIKDGWQPFDHNAQAPLEEAYKKYQADPSDDNAVAQIQVRGRKVMVNFKEMWQMVKGNDRKRTVQRIMV